MRVLRILPGPGSAEGLDTNDPIDRDLAAMVRQGLISAEMARRHSVLLRGTPAGPERTLLQSMPDWAAAMVRNGLPARAAEAIVRAVQKTGGRYASTPEHRIATSAEAALSVMRRDGWLTRAQVDERLMRAIGQYLADPNRGA